MNNAIEIQTSTAPAVAPFHVNHRAGSMIKTVSSQWASRPDDQKYTNLNDLYDFTRARAQVSTAAILDVQKMHVRSSMDDPLDMRIIAPAGGNMPEMEMIPNHWSFGQMCTLLGVPAGYMRRLHGAIAGINIQYALSNFRQEMVKAYVTNSGALELRAMTGPEYGRIMDYTIVDAVRRIAGDGTGRDGYHWKIPGVMNWTDGTYNPNAEITKQSTTLFASDRDIFLFLVDDRRPIKIGTFTDPQTGAVHDDLIYRGFYVYNSEVGSRAFGIATFYLRGVCQNRCLWGVERFNEIRFPHTKNAPGRFMSEVMPALESFSNHNTDKLLQGIDAARAAVVANNDDERAEFLQKNGFSKSQVSDIIDRVVREEGKPARSIWDFVQGITAHARDIGTTDARLDIEKKAGALLNKVTGTR